LGHGMAWHGMLWRGVASIEACLAGAWAGQVCFQDVLGGAASCCCSKWGWDCTSAWQARACVPLNQQAAHALATHTCTACVAHLPGTAASTARWPLQAASPCQWQSCAGTAPPPTASAAQAAAAAAAAAAPAAAAPVAVAGQIAAALLLALPHWRPRHWHPRAHCRSCCRCLLRCSQRHPQRCWPGAARPAAVSHLQWGGAPNGGLSSVCAYAMPSSAGAALLVQGMAAVVTPIPRPSCCTRLEGDIRTSNPTQPHWQALHCWQPNSPDRPSSTYWL